MNIPLLGMGTWGMGGKFTREENNIEESVKTIREGLKLGYRLIDVAELYGEGLTETIVGKAIKDFPRKDLFIISKVSRENLGSKDIKKAIKGSLERLGVTYIDLYLVHKENPNIPLSETMKAMEEIADEGLVKFIGVSNFSIKLMAEAQSYLDHTKIVANEIEFNFTNKATEQETIAYAKRNNITIIAARPFSKGEILKNPPAIIEEISKKHKKTPAQIILNWIVSKGFTPIPKASDLSHLKENIESLNFSMTKEDLLKLG